MPGPSAPSGRGTRSPDSWPRRSGRPSGRRRRTRAPALSCSYVIAVVAVGPAEVVAVLHLHQLLGRVLRVGLVGEAPVLAQLVAAEHRGPDGAGARLDAERLALRRPGREAAPVGEALALPRRVEGPDPRVAFQLRAGIDALRAGHPVHPLAAVGGGGDVHEHRGRPNRTRGSSPCGRRRWGGRPRRSPARPRARAGPARASSGESGRSARGRDSRRAARRRWRRRGRTSPAPRACRRRPGRAARGRRGPPRASAA